MPEPGMASISSALLLQLCSQLSAALPAFGEDQASVGKRTELFKLFPEIWKSLEGFSSKKNLILGYLYFGICRQCFWKAEERVGIFQQDGAAAWSPVEGKLPPSPSLPASASGFPLFPSLCLCQALGEPRMCDPQGVTPKAASGPAALRDPRPGRPGKPPRNIQNPWEIQNEPGGIGWEGEGGLAEKTASSFPSPGTGMATIPLPFPLPRGVPVDAPSPREQGAVWIHPSAP